MSNLPNYNDPEDILNDDDITLKEDRFQAGLFSLLASSSRNFHTGSIWEFLKQESKSFTGAQTLVFPEDVQKNKYDLAMKMGKIGEKKLNPDSIEKVKEYFWMKDVLKMYPSGYSRDKIEERDLPNVINHIVHEIMPFKEAMKYNENYLSYEHLNLYLEKTYIRQ
jgi:hypothetical protein